MGVYQRKSGNFCYEIKTKNEKGKWETLDARYDFPTRDAATTAWIEAKAKLLVRKTHTTFFDACSSRLSYLQDYTVKEDHEKVSKSYANNRARIRRFMAWAELPIEDITKDMIRDRLREMKKEFTPANVNKHLIALKAVFNHMINEQKLAINPCKGIPYFATESQSKYIPEVADFVQILLLAKPMDRAYLTVVAYSAARVGEINKLTWDDVNFEKASIQLWTRKKSGATRTARWVPVGAKVIESLRYAYLHRTKNSPWVFTNPKMADKLPLEPARWRWIYRDKFLHTLCNLAGVPRIGYHNLRHRAASNMMARGGKLVDVQHILGHERATTTNLYLQSLGFNCLRETADLMEDEIAIESQSRVSHG